MSDWDDIQSTLRIEEVVDALGISVVQKRGNEWTASCPLPSHAGADKNPSFGINVEKMVYQCFACGGGSIIGLVREIEGMEYEEALEWLLPFSDADSEDSNAFVEQIVGYLNRQPKMAESRKVDLPYFSPKVIDPYIENVQDIKEWLDDRHISLKVAKQLKIGYDPAHERRDYTGEAVIIPHFVKGQLVGYQERWLDENRPKKIGKYTNTSEFPKGDTLYNFDDALARKEQPPIIVESALTVARLLSSGYSSMATFGASVTDRQIKKLRAFDHIILSYDNDEAGNKAVTHLVKGLEDYCYVEIVDPIKMSKGDLGDLDDAALDRHLESHVSPAFMRELDF